MRVLASGVAMLALTACVSVNPVTLMRLATLDPLTADPTQMAVQMVLPEGIGVEDGSAHVRLQAENGMDSFDERFALVSQGDVWRIDPEVRDGFRAAQARAAAWETADENASSGAFGVGFEPCTLGEGPAADARVSLNIQLEPGASFLPLISNVRVQDVAEDGAVEALQPCGSAE